MKYPKWSIVLFCVIGLSIGISFAALWQAGIIDEQAGRIVELEGALTSAQLAKTSCLDFTGAGCDKKLSAQLEKINAKLDTIGHKLMRDDVANQLRIKR